MSQPPFHFVTVHAGESQKSKPWMNPDERRKVRVTVMQDYIRQKKDPLYKFSPASLSSDRKAHMARFRPISKMQRAINHIQARPDLKYQRPNRLLAQRPQSEETEHVEKILRIHVFGGIDPFRIVPVDLSDPETLKLVEYYFKSYWSNSMALNPNGGWSLVALGDKATMHAKLSLVAVHKSDHTRQNLPSAYFRHRGYALKLIAERLAQGADALSDKCIGAVSILSSSDYHSSWPDEVLENHSSGIAALVEKRGGIDACTLDKNVSRVIAWLDLLHAAIRESPLMMGRSRHAQEANPSEISNLTGKPRTSNAAGRRALQGLPFSVRNIFRQIRTLGEIKTTLSTRRIPRLSEMFSDMIWKTEYDILELANHEQVLKQSEWSDTSIFDSLLAFAALRDAFIIHSYSTFRDQNSIILYGRLSRRLEQYLFELIDSLQGLSVLPTRELVLLLWELYTGWKGATLAHEVTSWFASQAAQICRVLVLDDEDKVMGHVKSLAWDEENDVKTFPAFWDELNVRPMAL